MIGFARCPIALFPDPLLAQTLAASTYPLENYSAPAMDEANKNLKGQGARRPRGQATLGP